MYSTTDQQKIVPSTERHGGDYDSEFCLRALIDAIRSVDAPSIRPEELKDIRRIGLGGYGEVRLALWGDRSRDVYNAWHNPRHVAVKWLKPQQHTFLRLAIRFARELKVWSRLKHPNILFCLGFNTDFGRNEAYFVSRYLQHGNIHSRLNMGFNITVEQRKKWVVDVTNGLAYLHSLSPPVAHGDLKSENVLLDGGNSAVLCDFGLSSLMEDSMATGLTTSDGFKESTRWCSPELLEGEKRTSCSDMWAWALCVLEITTGRLPYYGIANEFVIFKRIFEQRYPTPVQYPELPSTSRIWQTLEKCLQKDPWRRPTVHDCLTQVCLPSSHSTLSTTKVWDEVKAKVWELSRGGGWVSVSYPDPDKDFTNIAIENLETGHTMSIKHKHCKSRSYLNLFYGNPQAFSDGGCYWAWCDNDEGRQYIYDIQGPAARLVMDIYDQEHPFWPAVKIRFVETQVLLFHGSSSWIGLSLLKLQSVDAAGNAGWIRKSVPELGGRFGWAMSPNGQYTVVFGDDNLTSNRKADVYITESLLNFLGDRDSSAAFPHAVTRLPAHATSGFWIGNTSYASVSDDEEHIFITDLEYGTTRRVVLPPRDDLSERFDCNESWLLYRRSEALFCDTLYFYRTPTILASVDGFTWDTSVDPPHFRVVLNREVSRVETTASNMLIWADVRSGETHGLQVAERIHKASSWW